MDDALKDNPDEARLTKPRAFGSVLSFVCDEGYELVGDRMIYCFGNRESPEWIGKPGHCVPGTAQRA